MWKENLTLNLKLSQFILSPTLMESQNFFYFIQQSLQDEQHFSTQQIHCCQEKFRHFIHAVVTVLTGPKTGHQEENKQMWCLEIAAVLTVPLWPAGQPSFNSSLIVWAGWSMAQWRCRGWSAPAPSAPSPSAWAPCRRLNSRSQWVRCIVDTCHRW